MLEINPEEALLQSVVEALRQGDTVHAKEFITRLLKDDQNNATYWVWMSAAVDSPKERIYCLQTALKIDPQNTSAKRGLVMLGALPPDDSIPPFPLNNPRSWEGALNLAGEENHPTGFKGLMANPIARLAGIIAIAAAFIGIAFLVFFFARPSATTGPVQQLTRYQSSTPTVTETGTATPIFRTATPTVMGATPLVMLLKETYTPTPLLVNTPHPEAEAYRAGLRFFQKSDYQNTIIMMQQVATLIPSAADAYYYMGISYFELGDYENAQTAFERGITANPDFSLNYVGYARSLTVQNPKANVQKDLDTAIAKDPSNAEAYAVRAGYELAKETPDYEAALADAQKSIELAPGSPTGYIYAAQTYLALEQPDEALGAALKAHEIDFTSLEAYRILGMAYMANEEYEKALNEFRTYLLYKPDDGEVNTLLAEINLKAGNYQDVVDSVSKVLEITPKDGYALMMRGKAYLALAEYDKALEDLKLAQGMLPYVPEANILRGVALYKNNLPRDAYIWFKDVADRMKTDEERAELFYWRAKSLEAIEEWAGAAYDWQAILNLPEESVTTEMRAEAEESLFKIYTPTPEPTSTPTPKVTATPTRKP